MYREYSQPIKWGEAKSAMSEEVGLDEAQRLEARAAAARAEIVGEERVLDLFSGGSSPFAEKGRALGAAIVEGGGEESEGKRKNDGSWLLEGLKLESMTTTNRAVKTGMGLERVEDGGWGWLAGEIQGLGGNEEGAGAVEEIEGLEGGTEMAGFEKFERASAELNRGEIRTERTEGREGWGTVIDESEGRRREEQQGSGQLQPQQNQPAAAEMTRIKELLASMTGGAGMEGLTAGTGGGAPEMPKLDWGELTKGGSVADLITAGRAGSDVEWGAAGMGGTESGAGAKIESGWGSGMGSGWGSATPSASMAWGTGNGGMSVGGWESGWKTGGGGWGGMESGGSGWGSGMGEMGGISGMSGMGSGSGVGGAGGGLKRASEWVETRPAGGGYRPAWD